MALAKATIVQRIRELLNDRPWETTSTNADTAATVAVPDGTLWAAGDFLEWTHSATGTGERALVQSVSVNNLTTVRGYGLVAATAHTSGDRVIKNPAFTYDDIVTSVDEVLNSLWPNAWKAVTQDVTPDVTKMWIDSGLSSTELDAITDLSSVVQVHNTTDLGTYGPHHGRRVLVRRNMPTGTWASGAAVRFPDGYYSPTATVTFTYRAKLTDTISGSNYSDLDDGNALAEGVVWLAAARLLTKKEATHEDGMSHLTALQDGGFYEQRGFELIARYRQQLMLEVPRMRDHMIGG